MLENLNKSREAATACSHRRQPVDHDKSTMSRDSGDRKSLWLISVAANAAFE
jgi:hypothetical protein